MREIMCVLRGVAIDRHAILEELDNFMTQNIQEHEHHIEKLKLTTLTLEMIES